MNYKYFTNGLLFVAIFVIISDGISVVFGKSPLYFNFDHPIFMHFVKLFVLVGAAFVYAKLSMHNAKKKAENI